jgi:hypothetical protein
MTRWFRSSWLEKNENGRLPRVIGEERRRSSVEVARRLHIGRPGSERSQAQCRMVQKKLEPGLIVCTGQRSELLDTTMYEACMSRAFNLLEMPRVK